jgi:replicative DNA helicase
MGKTVLAVNCAVSAALAKTTAAIFSFEMRRKQIEYRVLSGLSKVPLTRILSGHVGSPDQKLIAEALEAMHAMPLHVDDKAGQTVSDVRAACRRLRAERGLGLVIVDYVQLMPGTLNRRGATRNEELTDISRRFKVMADELQVPVMVLSQLKRQEGRPKLDDLRESGALEQDADIVGLLYRKNHRESGTTEFILAKQRNGPTGTLNLTIDRDIVTFTDGGEPVPEPTAEEKQASRRRTRQRTFQQRFANVDG